MAMGSEVKAHFDRRTTCQAQVAPVSPMDNVFGALGGEMDEAPPDLPAEVCLYIRKLLTLANDHEILKGALFNVPQPCLVWLHLSPPPMPSRSLHLSLSLSPSLSLSAYPCLSVYPYKACT